MSEIDDLWRTGLRAEAVTIELADDGSAERVVRRARRRSARRRGAVGVVASGLVIASGLAWQANRAHQRDTPQDLVVQNEPDGGADGGGAAELPVRTTTGPQVVDPATLPDVALTGAAPTWTAADVPWGKAMTYASSVRSGQGGLVGVSTAPGVSTGGDEMASTLYTSSDGVTWTSAALTGSHWFGDIVPSDGRLVAVGTAAATGKIDRSTPWGVGDVVVAVSDDQGRSWRDVVLPIDLRGAADRLKARGGDGTVSVTSARIAHGSRGWLVAVSVRATVDGAQILPAGVDTTYGVASTYDGVAVFAKETDPERAAVQACAYGTGVCDAAARDKVNANASANKAYTPTVAHVYTWAELGFDAATAELLHGTVKLFASADGERFTPVAGPDGVGTTWAVGMGAMVTATADGFAVALSDSGCCTLEQITQGASPSTATRVWRTTDLTTWEALDPVDVGGNGPFGTNFGEIGGRLVLVGSQNQLPVVAVADGTRWTVSPLGKPLVKSDEQVVNTMGSVGAAGIAVSVSVLDDPWADTGLSVEDSGYTLRVESRQRGFSVLDTNGKVVLTTPDPFVKASQDGLTLQPAPMAQARPGSLDSPTTAAGVFATVPYPSTTTVVGPIVGAVTDATVPVSTVAGRPVLAATTTTLLQPPGANTYTVQPGDIGIVVAKRHGMTIEQLRAANPGVDLDKIVPDQVLNLPDGATAVVGTAPTAEPGSPFGGKVVLTDASGKTLATFDVTDMEQQLQQLQGASGMGHVRTRVLVSRDAATWSLVDLGEVTGTKTATIQNLVVTGDRVLATVNTDENDPDAPKPPYEGMPPFRKTKVVVGRFA